MKRGKKFVGVNPSYLAALEALAQQAADVEWLYDADDREKAPSIGFCPWCACSEREGHKHCPFGLALARWRKAIGKLAR
jgi:hypothetical protein